jgi:hypothetical protein
MIPSFLVWGIFGSGQIPLDPWNRRITDFSDAPEGPGYGQQEERQLLEIHDPSDFVEIPFWFAFFLTRQ